MDAAPVLPTARLGDGSDRVAATLQRRCARLHVGEWAHDAASWHTNVSMRMCMRSESSPSPSPSSSLTKGTSSTKWATWHAKNHTNAVAPATSRQHVSPEQPDQQHDGLPSTNRRRSLTSRIRFRKAVLRWYSNKLGARRRPSSVVESAVLAGPTRRTLFHAASVAVASRERKRQHGHQEEQRRHLKGADGYTTEQQQRQRQQALPGALTYSFTQQQQQQQQSCCPEKKVRLANSSCSISTQRTNIDENGTRSTSQQQPVILAASPVTYYGRPSHNETCRSRKQRMTANNASIGDGIRESTNLSEYTPSWHINDKHHGVPHSSARIVPRRIAVAPRPSSPEKGATCAGEHQATTINTGNANSPKKLVRHTVYVKSCGDNSVAAELRRKRKLRMMKLCAMMEEKKDNVKQAELHLQEAKNALVRLIVTWKVSTNQQNKETTQRISDPPPLGSRAAAILTEAVSSSHHTPRRQPCPMLRRAMSLSDDAENPTPDTKMQANKHKHLRRQQTTPLPSRDVGLLPSTNSNSNGNGNGISNYGQLVADMEHAISRAQGVCDRVWAQWQDLAQFVSQEDIANGEVLSA